MGEFNGPSVIAYGGGTNSTAMIVGMIERGERIDAILFADTGGEKPGTYAHVAAVSEWLVSKGLPAIVVVKKGGRQETLEENCHRMNALPSLAYGFKSCSQKYKREPQDKWVNNWPTARESWAAGVKVVKCIGFDADEERRVKNTKDDPKYTCRYPLIEWGWGREECVEAIARAGLPQPGKSSCFFCPASTVPEIRDLRDNHPDLFARALAMEDQAELTSVKGLGRRFAWRIHAIPDANVEVIESRIEQDCGCYDG